MNAPNDDCLARYLSGEASAGEQEEVARWMKEDPENVRKMELLEEDLRFIAAHYHENAFSIDTGWNKFIERQLVIVGRDRRRLYSRVAAALIILLAGTAFWFYQHQGKGTRWTNIITGPREQRKIVLPDSSIVTLAPSSSLAYTVDRKIRLEGKAFFEVTQAAHRSFSVSTQQLEVAVLGTSFLIDEKADGTKIIVSSGKVRVTEKRGDRQVILAAGKEVAYLPEAGKLESTSTTDVNWLSWKTGVLCFKNTPLPEALNRIGEYYHVRLYTDSIPEQQLAAMRLSATFDQRSLYEAIYTIEQIFDITLKTERIN